jgi:hypothetical protein
MSNNNPVVCLPRPGVSRAPDRVRLGRRLTMRCQGDIYAKIIEEVVNNSTNDFEENGVNQSTLSELQKVRFSAKACQGARRPPPVAQHLHAPRCHPPASASEGREEGQQAPGAANAKSRTEANRAGPVSVWL